MDILFGLADIFETLEIYTVDDIPRIWHEVDKVQTKIFALMDNVYKINSRNMDIKAFLIAFRALVDDPDLSVAALFVAKAGVVDTMADMYRIYANPDKMIDRLLIENRLCDYLLYSMGQRKKKPECKLSMAELADVNKKYFGGAADD